MVRGFGPNSAVVGPKLDPKLFFAIGRRQADADYARFAFTSATQIITRLPSARAARVIVSSVTETLRGSSRRSSCDLLVWSCFAIACFVFCCSCMACSSCHASTRLIATASTSSRIPSSSRKLSKVDPLRSIFFRSFFFMLIAIPFGVSSCCFSPTLNPRRAPSAFS